MHFYSVGHLSPLCYPTDTSRKPARHDGPQSTIEGKASKILVKHSSLFPASHWFYFLVRKNPKFILTRVVASGKLWALVYKRGRYVGCHVTLQPNLCCTDARTAHGTASEPQCAILRQHKTSNHSLHWQVTGIAEAADSVTKEIPKTALPFFRTVLAALLTLNITSSLKRNTQIISFPCMSLTVGSALWSAAGGACHHMAFRNGYKQGCSTSCSHTQWL